MIYLLPVTGLLALALAFALWRLDRFRASREQQKLYLEAALAKARADRRDHVKLDAETLAKAFLLDGRTLRRAAELRPGKLHRHPATLTPARRRRLGGAP